MARKTTVLIASDRAGSPAASPVRGAVSAAVPSLRFCVPGVLAGARFSSRGIELRQASPARRLQAVRPARGPFVAARSIEPALLASAGFFLAAGISVGAAQ
ncbi:hypothetical protein [Segnochrobactrum spirostomi]|uniref:Uncharacterized protein n=1 Tax=Segnochrobactrum spirostomi TaxID=2608987 RepID=A0A6A7Y0Z8_9HYPH|nr:hypothetical protein [Segnochrobactrum spirostomi]MQT12425.1 hypothetical protein [Segnochrobactrum spirostomi]